MEKIAERQRCSVRHVNLTISMAFIALGLVNAAVRCGIGVARWRDGVKGRIPGDVRLRNRIIPSFLMAQRTVLYPRQPIALLQSRSDHFHCPRGPKNVFTLCFVDRLAKT